MTVAAKPWFLKIWIKTKSGKSVFEHQGVLIGPVNSARFQRTGTETDEVCWDLTYSEVKSCISEKRHGSRDRDRRRSRSRDRKRSRSRGRRSRSRDRRRRSKSKDRKRR